MSFILDAIKKSEQERDRARAPSVHTLQDGGKGHGKVRSRRSGLVLLAIALGLLAAGAYWLWPKISTPILEAVRHQLEQQSVAGQQQPSAATSPAPATVTPATVQAPADPGQPRSDYQMDDELPPRHLIKELWELPADYQSTVPAMEFSFHVFSQEPANRTIIINGRRVREGQLVAAGLKLRSITENGLILFYRGRFFHIDVIEKW